MSLFGKQRDVKFFRGVNREVLHKIVSVYVDVYQLSMNQTKVNLYGEAEQGSKVYYQPVRVACRIADDPQSAEYIDRGVDVGQTCIFKFLADDLTDANLTIDIGDIIYWNNGYYEVDNMIKNKLLLNKDPDTNLADSDTGYNSFIDCVTHLTKHNKLQLVRTRSGKN